MKRSYEIDMCNGPLMGKLLRFSLPLMCSGILQLLFNAADIVVVGQFTGSQALAAVGATGPLNNLNINVFLGLSIGSSIITARYYGAQDWKNVHDTVHTTVLLSLISGVIMTFAGILLARPLLQLMGTPDDVLDQAVVYMKIIFAGVTASMVYNFGAAILRAVGDTRRPLMFLLIAGVINVLLNLLFVIVFKLGVAGVALATIISQCISAVLVILCLMHGQSAYQLSLRELHISKDKLLQILRVGLPAGIQSALFSLSNMLIQSSINSFGSEVMAGNTAASNIEGFVYTSTNAVYQAAMSFTSQNVGARKKERIMPIFWRCLLLTMIIGIGLSSLVVTFGTTLLHIYSPDDVVVGYGLKRLQVVCTTYVLCGLMEIACGMIRGLGYSILPTIVTLTGACGLRILWVMTIFPLHRTQTCLYLSYPVSWIITFSCHVICFIVLFRRWGRSMENKQEKKDI